MSFFAAFSFIFSFKKSLFLRPFPSFVFHKKSLFSRYFPSQSLPSPTASFFAVSFPKRRFRGLCFYLKEKIHTCLLFRRDWNENQNRSFSRRFSSFCLLKKKKCKKINFFKPTKMKIKIVVLHSNFQLLEKKCTQIFFLG